MTHPSGPAGTHPPYRTIARSLFEGVVIGGLILIPLFIAIAWVRGQS